MMTVVGDADSFDRQDILNAVRGLISPPFAQLRGLTDFTKHLHLFLAYLMKHLCVHGRERNTVSVFISTL